MALKPERKLNPLRKSKRSEAKQPISPVSLQKELNEIEDTLKNRYVPKRLPFSFSLFFHFPSFYLFSFSRIFFVFLLLFTFLNFSFFFFFFSLFFPL